MWPRGVGSKGHGQLPEPDAGKFETTREEPQPPDYLGAMRAAEKALDRVWTDQDPRIAGVLTLIRAFDDFNALTIERGLDEESLTSAFLGHLASSTRTTDWLCKSAGVPVTGDSLTWLHHSKRAEAAVGADFALFLPIVPKPGQYRLVVCQAKKEEPNSIDLSRPSNWGQGITRAEDETDEAFAERKPRETAEAEAWAKVVLIDFHNRLKSPSPLDETEQDVVEEEARKPQWQLTKLLMQELRLRSLLLESGPEAITVCYAIWPVASGRVPHYATLDQTQLAFTDLDPKSEKEQKAQSVLTSALKPDLRSLLLQAAIGETHQGLSLEQALSAFDIVAPDVRSVGILSLGEPGPALALEAGIKAKHASLAPRSVMPLEAMTFPSLTPKPGGPGW